MSYPEDLKGKDIKGYEVDRGTASAPSPDPSDPSHTRYIRVDEQTPAVGTFEIREILKTGGWLFSKPKFQLNLVAERLQFKYLTYKAGVITKTLLDSPIATGPFSGCYAFTYKQGGQLYLAHVGTYDTKDNPHSIAVKTEWDSFAGGAGIDMIKGARPADYFHKETDALIEEYVKNPKGKDSFWKKVEEDIGKDNVKVENFTPVTIAYFTPAGGAYAILLRYMQVIKPPQSLTLVVDVKPMVMKDWNLIRRDFL